MNGNGWMNEPTWSWLLLCRHIWIILERFDGLILRQVASDTPSSTKQIKQKFVRPENCYNCSLDIVWSKLETGAAVASLSLLLLLLLLFTIGPKRDTDGQHQLSWAGRKWQRLSLSTMLAPRPISFALLVFSLDRAPLATTKAPHSRESRARGDNLSGGGGCEHRSALESTCWQQFA